MSYVVSTATIDDLDHVAKLIDDYVRQNLNLSSWTCSIAKTFISHPENYMRQAEPGFHAL